MADFHTRQHNAFFWIEFSTGNFDLSDLLTECPGILIDKYLVVICFDSGSLELVAEEKSNGWYEKNGIAYSPKLTSLQVSQLPHEQFDQWCLFKMPTEFSEMTGFVNYGDFSLRSQRQELIVAGPTLNRQIECHEQLVEQFWQEVTKLNAINYIADGDNFIFVSQDINEIERLKNCLT